MISKTHNWSVSCWSKREKKDQRQMITFYVISTRATPIQLLTICRDVR